MVLCVLYKWPECWGLPSLSPACIQVEAYLRLCGTTQQFAVEACATDAKSPTGRLPALERDAYVSTAEVDEFAAAKAIIVYARKHMVDLDAQLSGSQRAELLAFSTTIDAKLNLATTVCMWLEPTGFAEFKKAAFGNKLPFPLSHLIPWNAQREVRHRCAQQQPDAEQVYNEAATVIGALADKLAGKQYFFGDRPSSLDALAAGHLLFYRHSPAAAPVLRQAVERSQVLCSYLERLLKDSFARAMPLKADLEDHASSSWSSGAKGEKAQPKAPPTQAELDFRRSSWRWMIGAGAAVALYVLLSGRYIQFQQVATAVQGAMQHDDDDGDDDEGDEGDDPE